MTIELPPLDSEPLIYFLAHSGVFVAILALIFFLIGLAFGRAAWGKYKSRARTLAVETEAQRNEIADLKRKLAEQHLRPLPALEPAPPQATAPAEPVRGAAPARQAILKMPELAGGTPLPETPAAPARPVPPRPRPAAVATAGPARPPKAEPAAIAPFSFLSDDPAPQPPSKA